MKRLIAILLVAMTVLTTFIACAENPDDSGDTNDTLGGSNSPLDINGTDTAAPAFNDELLEIPDEKFDGEEFVILTPKIVTYCYALADFDEPSDDAYENAFYERNLAVEEMLGINISQVEADIGGGVYALFKTAVEANDDSYDITFNNMSFSSTATGAGLCYDIDSFEYIDLEKAWWNDDATEQLRIGDKHYMVAGDIVLSDKEGLWAVYFLKDMITDLGLENPYELVNNNLWTIDKMYEMGQAAANDVDGSGTMTKGNDTWGIVTHHENFAASWQGAGLKLINQDENGIPEATWGNEQFVDVYTHISEIMGDKDVLNYDDVGFITTALKNGKTLFGTEIIAFVRDYRENEHEFGILPYPKYDSSVPEYYSYIVTNACCMTIGNNTPDTYKTSIITETMAAKGYEILIPVYYEGQLKSRYSNDEESGAMLDIIFEHRSYDLGVFFDWGSVYSTLQSPAINPSTLWAGTEKVITKSIQKSLQKLGIF